MKKRNITIVILLLIITYFISYRITMHNIIPQILSEHEISLKVYNITDTYYVEQKEGIGMEKEEKSFLKYLSEIVDGLSLYPEENENSEEKNNKGE